MENIIKTSKFDADFDGIKWAIAARSNDETRKNIQGVNVDNGLIVATNGHRLHCYVADRDIPSGTYAIVKETKDMIILDKTDLEYPDYERVFPQHTHNGIKDLSTHTRGGKNSALDHETNVLNHILRQSQNCFNVKYLLDACPANEDLHFEQCGEAGDLKPLVIRNQDYTKAALVMPYKDK